MTDVESPRSENGPEVTLTTTGRVMSSESDKTTVYSSVQVSMCMSVQGDTMSEVCKPSYIREG